MFHVIWTGETTLAFTGILAVAAAIATSPVIGPRRTRKERTTS